MDEARVNAKLDEILETQREMRREVHLQSDQLSQHRKELADHRTATSEITSKIAAECRDQGVTLTRLDERVKAQGERMDRIDGRLDRIDGRISRIQGTSAGAGGIAGLVLAAIVAGFKELTSRGGGQ